MSTLPLRCIVGAEQRTRPLAFREDQIAVAAQGLYATVSEIEGSGHFVSCVMCVSCAQDAD